MRRWLRKRFAGLSMIELVMAIGLLFLASSFLMSMFLTGATFPRHIEDNLKLEALAQGKMDEVLALPNYVVPTAVPPTPLDATHTFQMSVQPASFDSSMLEVVVKVDSSDGKSRELRAIRPPGPPEPAWDILTSQYDCLSCHAVPSRPGAGTGDPAYAPSWTRAGLEASAAAAGVPLDVYIQQSIRTPGSYVVPGYGVGMGPSISGMSQAELDQIVDWMLTRLP